MQIESASLAALRTTFSNRFQEAFNEAPVWSDELVTEMPSTTRKNTYAFTEAILAMREWVGPRVAANVQARDYDLTNRDFEGTVELDRNDIEDDNLGLFTTVTMPGLALAARKNADAQFLAMLQANTDLCYDGKAFFANDHAIGPDGDQYTIDNLYTLALSDVNFLTVRNAMVSYQDGFGRSLGIRPTHIVVPPQLEITARTLFETPLISTGGTNVLQNIVKVKVVDEFSNDPTTWYLADLSKPIKPLIKQVRKAAQFVSKDAPTDESVFERKKFRYGVDSREAFGYSLPFLMAKSTP